MWIVADAFVFSVLQLGLVGILLYAYIMEKIMKADIPSVRRGEKAWNYFYLGYGITNMLLLQIINVTSVGVGYKVVISIIDISILTYLAFLNAWYRNWVIHFVVKSQTKEE